MRKLTDSIFQKIARYSYILILLCLPALLSCTREISEVSKIKLDLNSHGKTMTLSSTYQPGIFIINVRGPGIPSPIIMEWENPCWHNGVPNCTAVPPTYLEVEVPSGSDRLIQVLSVYYAENDSMTYYYGDTVSNLAGSNVSVTVPISPVGSGDSDARIIARYLNANGIGPTGPLQVRYQPVNNRPAMILSKTETIIAGWMNVFAIDGATLTYIFAPTNETLFTVKVEGSNFYIDGSLVSPSAPYLMTIDVPTHYTYHYDSTTGQDIYHESSPNKILYGFLGPGGLSKAACKLSTTSLSSTSRTSGTIDNMYWRNQGSCVAGDICATGGLNNGDSACTTNVYADYLQPIVTLFGSGIERALGINSGFKAFMQDSYYRYSYTTRNLNTLNITWQYLPGVDPQLNTASSLSGVDIFYKLGSTSYDSSPSCSKIIESGYALLTTSSSNTATATIGSPEGGLIAICPYKTINDHKSYAEKAIMDQFDPYSAPKLQITGLTPPYSTGACISVDFSVTGNLSSGFDFDISTTDSATIEVYTDASCSTSAGGTVLSMPVGGTLQASIKVKQFVGYLDLTLTSLEPNIEVLQPSAIEVKPYEMYLVSPGAVWASPTDGVPFNLSIPVTYKDYEGTIISSGDIYENNFNCYIYLNVEGTPSNMLDSWAIAPTSCSINSTNVICQLSKDPNGTLPGTNTNYPISLNCDGGVSVSNNMSVYFDVAL